MARNATDGGIGNNSEPTEEMVQAAVQNIESYYTALLHEKSEYMTVCKSIRGSMATEYDNAADHGISKKLLKKIIKERDYERKIDALTADLELDEEAEHDMLVKKLGDFGNLPLGQAAIERTAGKETLASVGA